MLEGLDDAELTGCLLDGVRLTAVDARRLRLTEAGSAFYHKARGALATLEEAALVEVPRADAFERISGAGT